MEKRTKGQLTILCVALVAWFACLYLVSSISPRLIILYDREVFVENGMPLKYDTVDDKRSFAFYFNENGKLIICQGHTNRTLLHATALAGHRFSVFTDGVINDDITVPSGCSMTDDG